MPHPHDIPPDHLAPFPTHATCLAELLPPDAPPLNAHQRRAVEACDAAQLVLAGPGTGKTRVLVYRAAYLMLRPDAPLQPTQIGLFTFTNTAARQLRDRLGHLVGPQAQHVAAGTLHHFAYRLVRAHWEALGLDRRFTVADDLRLDAYWEAWCQQTRSPYKPQQVSNAVSLAKLGLSKLPRDLFDAQERYDAWLHKRNHLDFDDLLLHARELVRHHPEIVAQQRERRRALLVDEFQDVDPVQYEIITALGGEGGRGLFCVADDDQSIYGFRGAQPENVARYMRAFECHRSTDRHHVLRLNYRSGRSIYACAESVLAGAGQRLKRAGDIETTCDGTDDLPVTLIEGLADEHDEAAYVLRCVERLMAAGRASPGDIAVLAPSNLRLREFEDALLRAWVPCETSQGGRLIEAPLMRELAAAWHYLRAATSDSSDADPRVADDLLRDWAYLTLPQRAKNAHHKALQRYLGDAERAGTAPPSQPVQQVLWWLSQTQGGDLDPDEHAEIRVFTSTVLNLTALAKRPGCTVATLTEAALEAAQRSASPLAEALGTPAALASGMTTAARHLRAALDRATAVYVQHDQPAVAKLWAQIVADVLAAQNRSLPVRTGRRKQGRHFGAVQISLRAETGSLWPSPAFVLGDGPDGVDPEGRFASPSVRLFLLLQEAFATEEKPLYDDYVMVDLEATSLDTKRCRVAEIGALRVRAGRPAERFAALVALPHDLTPEEAETLRTICHLDPARDFAGARPEAEVWRDFDAFVDGLPIVAHNGQFYDFRILDRLGKRYGARNWSHAHDILPDARRLCPDLPAHDAEALREALLGETTPTAHRALADCDEQQRILAALQALRARRATALQFESVLPLVAVATALEPGHVMAGWTEREQVLIRVGLLAYARGRTDVRATVTDALGRPDLARKAIAGSRKHTLLQLDSAVGNSFALRERLDALLAPCARTPIAEGGLDELLAFLALWRSPDDAGSTVTLSTYHSAKGLEFAYVFCTGVSDGAFPWWSDRKDPRKVDESKRVLYVGMTRAERVLSLTYAATNRWGKPEGASSFLAGLPAGHHRRVQAAPEPLGTKRRHVA